MQQAHAADVAARGRGVGRVRLGCRFDDVLRFQVAFGRRFEIAFLLVQAADVECNRHEVRVRALVSSFPIDAARLLEFRQ